MADQMSLQRYLSSQDLRSARRAFLINLIGVAVVIALLALVGLAMTVWYGLTPGAVAPARADEVFPTFVMTHLPRGVPGLIIAAILAATMSSMTSGVNSLAGTLTLDFAARTEALRDPRRQLWFGRGASLLIGLSATGVAGIVAQLGTIFEIAQMVAGLFVGPLLVCVVLSMVSLRVSAWSVMLGMIAGAAAGVAVIWSGAYGLWVAPATASIALAIPLLATATGMSRGAPQLAAVETHR
jgi:solute:Na+ symporter, SSS family